MCAAYKPGAAHHFDVPSVPVYYPTEEQWANNPLDYINSIRPEAEKYGVCNIVAPDSWQPEFRLPNKDDLRFRTRVQAVNELQNRPAGPSQRARENAAKAKAALEAAGFSLPPGFLLGGGGGGGGGRMGGGGGRMGGGGGGGRMGGGSAQTGGGASAPAPDTPPSAEVREGGGASEDPAPAAAAAAPSDVPAAAFAGNFAARNETEESGHAAGIVPLIEERTEAGDFAQVGSTLRDASTPVIPPAPAKVRP